MALTQSEIEAIITKLEKALGTGHASIEYEGRRVQYHSVADIQAAIAYFQGRLATVAGTSAPRQSFVKFRRD
jgi:hypothetical protein